MQAIQLKNNTEIELKQMNTAALDSDSDFGNEFGDDYFKKPDSSANLQLQPK